MAAYFSQFNGVEVFFLVCAVVGGAFVGIRFVMLLSGLHDGGGGDATTSGHDLDGHHADSDVGFKLLSLQGITSFLMMFGLVGMAFYHESRMGILISMIGGLAAGLASVWIIAKMFALVVRLQSSGTIPIESTVGAQGKVYLTIPENGTGRVLISVRNSLREYDASSQDNRRIETGKPVRVVWVDGNIVVVEAI
jgi:membrane protein implicated in regulation of membrane protease activity